MHPNGLKSWEAVNIWGAALLVLLPLWLGACASPATLRAVTQAPPEKRGDILEACAHLSDQEMQEMRGCYDTYYFSYNVTFDLVANNPQVHVDYRADVPPGSVPQLNNNTGVAQYQSPNGDVVFQAGMGGNGTLGKGFYSVLNVAGSNNIVVVDNKITLNLPNATSLIPSINIFKTPTLTGVK